jgi:hypothetical protein
MTNSEKEITEIEKPESDQEQQIPPEYTPEPREYQESTEEEEEEDEDNERPRRE